MPLISSQREQGIAPEFLHKQIIAHRLSAKATIELDRPRVRTIYIPLNDRVLLLHGNASDVAEQAKPMPRLR